MAAEVKVKMAEEPATMGLVATSPVAVGKATAPYKAVYCFLVLEAPAACTFKLPACLSPS